MSHRPLRTQLAEQAILKVLETYDAELTVFDIASELERPVCNVKRLLPRLVERGIVQSASRELPRPVKHYWLGAPKTPLGDNK